MAKDGGQKREGFLPFETNLFDRVFIGVITSVAIHLLWFRFMEQWIPIGAANILSLVVIYVTAKWG